MRRLLIAPLLLLTLLPLRAEVADSLMLSESAYERVTLSRLPQVSLADGVSVHHLRYRTSLSSLSLSYDWRGADRPIYDEEGCGLSIGRLRAETYLLPSEQEHLWGFADYARGVKKGVRWCSTSDYDRLYPFVVADEEGGDMSHESYAFGGGYSRSLYERLRLSGEMTYRSQQEYRTIDPRPRNIVSDLHAAAGAAYEIGAYDLGLSLGYGIYKQRSSVSFYSPLGATQQYLMSGLGGSFKRFDTNTPSLQYRGRELSAALHLLPRRGVGLMGSVEYRYRSLEQALSDMNDVPIHHYHDHGGQLRLAFLREGRHLRYGPELSLSGALRSGVEHIVGEPTAGTYPVMGYNPNFRRLLGEACLTLHLADVRGEEAGWHWTARPMLSYRLLDTRLLEPEKHLSVQGWEGALDMELAYRSRRDRYALLQLTLSGAPRSISSLSLPLSTMEPERVAQVTRHRDALGQSRWSIAIGPSYFMPLTLGTELLGLQLSCRYRLEHYTVSPQQSVLTEIKFTF